MERCRRRNVRLQPRTARSAARDIRVDDCTGKHQPLHAAIPRFCGDAGKTGSALTLKKHPPVRRNRHVRPGNCRKGKHFPQHRPPDPQPRTDSGEPLCPHDGQAGREVIPGRRKFHPLQYDPDCLQLTSVLKLHPAVELLTWNEPQPGMVHVSFSGTQPFLQESFAPPCSAPSERGGYVRRHADGRAYVRHRRKID